VAQVRRYYEEGYRWVIDADIDNFFDDVEHEHLLARLRESIPDEEFLQLVRAWLTAPLKDGGRLIERARGLPQGAPISPVLANLYLDRFDEALVAKGIRLVRFADDFVILCKERPQAEAALQLTEALLRDLQLSLDAGKTQVTHFDRGFRYLGHLFLRSMVIPSPNRLQRRDALVESPPPTPAGPVAEATPAPHARTTRAVRAVTPPVSDTAIARAMAGALQAAGRESLVLAESPSPPPPTAPAPRPEVNAAPEPEPSVPLSETTGADVAPRPARVTGPFRRTLYIQEQGTILARQGERLVVKKGEDVLLEVPAAKVDQIFVFGRCAITTPAMTFCLEEEIPVVLLSSRGRYYGLLDSPVGDRVSLHRQQFARAEDQDFCVATAKSIVRGKLSNCRVLLQRHQRRKGIDAVKAAIADIDAIIARLPQAKTLDEVRGYEGHGAARYFDAFARLVEPGLGFTRRVRRPPTDPVNSLLSLGYTLCFYNLYGLIRGRGLHPYVGHLHAMRDRHPALASDLVEEFRAPIVDSLVLYLVNAKILTAADFYRPQVDPDGACLLRDQGRKTFLKHFEQKMTTTITHPHTSETAEWRRAMDIQVAHMRQWIVGEVTEYRPMEIR
jgi:CRISPR-associated protein Cas1